MKYIITESRLDQVVTEYLNEIFPLDNVHYTNPTEYDNETGENYDDDTRVELESLLKTSLESEKGLDTSRKKLEHSQSILRNYEIDNVENSSPVNSADVDAKEEISHGNMVSIKEGKHGNCIDSISY